MSEPLSFPRNSGVADLGFHSGSTNEIMDHPHRWTVDAMIQKLFGYLMTSSMARPSATCGRY